MSSGPIIALEQFMNEIQGPLVAQSITKALAGGRAIQDILSPLHKVEMPEVAKLVTFFQESPSVFHFLVAKRKLFDLQKWLDAVKKGCQEHGSDPQHTLPLAEAQAALNDQLLSIDAHIPTVYALGKETFVTDYAEPLERATQELERILEREINKAQDKEDEWRKFFEVLKKELGVFADLALQQQDAHLQVILQEARSLYLTRFPSLHFSLLHSWTGAIYVVMDVTGQSLGEGVTKVVTRTAELETGEILALVKPRVLFLEAEEREKAFLRSLSFLESWRESDFLLQLQGTPGIISVIERIPFLIEGNNHLFLIEERYEDGTLETYFERLIEGKGNAPNHEKTAVACALQLLTGLKQLHGLWTIHRDIKSTNILCDWSDPDYPQTVLCDFNFACTLIETLLHKNAAFTACYGAPEYIHAYVHSPGRLGGEDMVPVTSFALDVWAMGLIFYQLFFLERFPWWYQEETESPDESVDIVYAHLRNLKEGWIPQKFENHRFYPLIRDMLRIDPKQRISAKQALEECQKLS